MSFQYVYPVADGSLTEWTLSTGTDHFAVLDETVPNETDKISVSGFSGGKIERLVMGTGDETITTVRGLTIEIHLKTANAGNVPAMRLRVYRSGAVIYFIEFECDTAGEWDDITITLPPQDTDSSIWYAQPLTVELIPINGDAGYSPAS